MCELLGALDRSEKHLGVPKAKWMLWFFSGMVLLG